MKAIKVNIKNVLGSISEADINNLDAVSVDAIEKLHKGSGLGNDFLGWLDLPSRTPTQEIDDIVTTANNLRANCEVVVAIGIGGSY